MFLKYNNEFNLFVTAITIFFVSQFILAYAVLIIPAVVILLLFFKFLDYKGTLIFNGVSLILSIEMAYFGLILDPSETGDLGYYSSFVENFLVLGGVSMDSISLAFIILTNLFIFLCVFSLNPKTTENLEEVLLHLNLLQLGVSLAFWTLDLLGFYIAFELTLIPIYFLVLVWGSRQRRIRASYLISIYTLLGSIFMFFNIIYIYSKLGTTGYDAILSVDFTQEEQRFLWITFFIAFAAKIPLFPLHIWLPEAHVEAPTIGSVLLAALLLKLGTYGLIRFSLPLFPEGTVFFGPLVSTLAVMGVIYTSITAIRQIDLKKIIAYSSVGHMNVVLLGIMSCTVEGLSGAIFQMLSHGVVSGALFFAVGVIYSRYSVRSLKYFGGLTFFYPLFAIVFLIFSMANISFPLTSSFVGEFLIFMGLFQYSFWATFFAATSMVLGAVYTLWTYNRIFFGNFKVVSLERFKDLDRKEVVLFGILIVILFWMGIFSSHVLDFFVEDVVYLLEIAKSKDFSITV